MPNPHFHRELDDMNPRIAGRMYPHEPEDRPVVPSGQLFKVNVISWAEEKLKEMTLREQLSQTTLRLDKLLKEIEQQSVPGTYIVKLGMDQYVVTVGLGRDCTIKKADTL